MTVPPSGSHPERSFERLEIDGVPAFAGQGSRYMGALLFRAGRGDETLHIGGVTHLVEHLALFGLGPERDYEFNGYVSGLVTGFFATGTPEEVTEFLAEVCRTLQDLPLGRLAAESRVLRAEAASRSSGACDELIWLRYGATGQGQRYLPELMLLAPDPAVVRAWAAERFTAGNAALWFSGPPPTGLRLKLPPGTRTPPPPLSPVADASYPAWVVGRSGGVGISFVRPREDWLNVPMEIAAHRLRVLLRFERGLTYDVGVAYEPVTSHLAHAALWAGCLAEHAAVVRDGIIEVLEEIGAHGATDEDLARARSRFRRRMEDPEGRGQEPAVAATNELLGYPYKSMEDLHQELEELDGPAIARRMAAALETALVLFPHGCPPPKGRFRPYPLWSQEQVRGRAFRQTRAPFPWSKGPRLIVGAEGVSMISTDGRAITVPFASCAAAVAHPDGILDVYGEDGFSVSVEPRMWRGGSEAVRLLLDAIPAGRLVRIAAPPGPP